MSREYWFLIDQLATGGAQRQLTTLSSGLRERGHRVRIDALRSEGLFVEQIRDAEVELHLLDRREESPARYLARYARDARRRRPDVIHAYLPLPNIAVALMKPLLGDIRVVWGVRVADLDLSHYNLIGRSVYRLEPLLARLPDLTIVNSSTGRDRVVGRGHPASRVVVVPNGVDTDRFRPDPVARRRQRRAWGILDDQILVGTVGRFDPAKDHSTFVRAMSLLAAAPDYRFVSVGGGAEASRLRLEALAASLGIGDRLRFTGDVQDMPAAYNALDVYCLTSRFEALPNALLEAMSVGLPCVATDVGDVADVVDGLFEPVTVGDHAAIADACRRAVGDVELGARLRHRVVTRFDETALVDRTVAVLEKVIVQGRSAARSPS